MVLASHTHSGDAGGPEACRRWLDSTWINTVIECVQQPPPTGDLGDIAGVNWQNSKGLCQGAKPSTGKLYQELMSRPKGGRSVQLRITA